MYKITAKLDFKRNYQELVPVVKSMLPWITKSISEEKLNNEIATFISYNSCDEIISIRKLVGYLFDKYFLYDNERGEFYDVCYKNSDESPIYQKRVFLVTSAIREHFQNIKLNIDEIKPYEYVIYIHNKRIFNSKKFKDICCRIDKDYEGKYGEVNYQIMLKED